MLPNHVKELLGNLYYANCFCAALHYQIPQPGPSIINNTFLKNTLKKDFVEIHPGTVIKMGDLMTVGDKSDTIHHAAIILSKEFVLEKPDAFLSPIRIIPLDTIFKEWNVLGPTLRIRFYRKK